MNDSFGLSSLEQIEEMDKQRLQAIQALEISDDSVKCQKCSTAVPLLRALTRPKSNRIDALQKQIKCIEDYIHSSGNNNAKAEVKQLKVEVAELLEQKAKANALRRLPLYRCRVTGWKFICSKRVTIRSTCML